MALTKIKGAGVNISATEKLYFDDGGNTYIYESGADVLDVYVGGANMVKLTESTTDTVTVTGDLTVGVDGTGHDVKFFGDTASAYMLWDQSADDLVLAGAAGIDLAGDIDVDGTANLDVVDIDGAVDMASTLTLAGNADFNGDLDVDGTTNLDAVDIDGAVNMAADLTMGANILMADDTSIGIADDAERIEFDGAGDISFLGCNVGIGTSAIPHGGIGVAKLAIEGTNASAAAGPHVQYTTANTDYPLFQQLNYEHDEIHLVFDAYYDGAWKSSDAGSNYKIDKSGDRLEFAYESGVAQGSAVTWTNAMVITTSGNVGIGDSDPSEAKLSIDNVASGDYGLKVVQAQNTQAVWIDNNGTASALYIENTGSTGRAMQIYSNGGSGQNSPLVQFEADNTGFDQPVLKVMQDGNSNGINIDTASTGTAAIEIESPATTDGTVFLAYSCDALNSGRIAYFHSNSSDATVRNLVQIRNQNVGASGCLPLYIEQDANKNSARFDASKSDYSSTMLLLNAVGRSASASFNFLEGYTDGDNDNQHILTGNGVTQNRSGTFESADYAEYFESKDGSKIAVGTTVKLNGDKIVACSEGDTPLGVVRPLASSIVGNAAWSHWQNKYLTDDYCSPVMEEYTVTEWVEDNTDEVKHEAVEGKDAVLYEEGDELPEGKEVGDVKEEAVEAKAIVYGYKNIQYQTDKIPSDVTVPNDATVTSTEEDGSKLMRRKLNPDYDESIEYESREERDEWHIVGLLGQIPITKGQPVADNWIKMNDFSDTVEMYFVK